MAGQLCEKGCFDSVTLSGFGQDFASSADHSDYFINNRTCTYEGLLALCCFPFSWPDPTWLFV
jgi:hypothetical protein